MKMGSASDAEQWPNDRFRDALKSANATDGGTGISKRAILVFGGVFTAIALLAGGLYLYRLLGNQPASEPKIETAAASIPPASSSFVEFPTVITNLRSETRSGVHVRLRVVVEISEPTAAQRLRAIQPRIMDGIYAQLWNRSYDQLRSPEGIEAMRAALTHVINRLIRPSKVDAVLIRELVVR